MKYTFKIKGLDCANCATQLENAIQKIEGIDNASINFMMEKMIIECQEENKQEIMEKLKKTIKKEEPDVKIEEI
ncbi:MAG: heavy metal transporter [Clostridia bacterium]|nr:heavy metal transporter [Clostridia bacterium]